MKTIAVVTDGLSKLECFLNKNLEMIFKDKVMIKNYYLNKILYLFFDYSHKHYTFKYFEV
ncbi:TPA: hypothetical protein ACXIIK_001129 [Clostridioides difficile]|nr:hypothetical protein [Clostridioides difficile]MDB3432248.1 hypothetical protein [Clostridioides difficile]